MQTKASSGGSLGGVFWFVFERRLLFFNNSRVESMLSTESPAGASVQANLAQVKLSEAAGAKVRHRAVDDFMIASPNFNSERRDLKNGDNAKYSKKNAIQNR